MIKKLDESNFEEVEEALIKFYNTRPDEYGLYERNQEAYNKYISNITPFLNKDSKILDFGTGSWRIVESIVNKGYNNVVGVDYFSKEKLEEYSSHLSDSKACLVSMQDNKIPFGDESFDVVTSLCVVEHLVRVEYFFEEMLRVLKPGGYLIIDCPNWSSPLVGITGMLKKLKGLEFWQFDSFGQAFSYLFSSLSWFIFDRFGNKRFNLIFPRMKDGDIFFEKSDDDAVHLCNPIRIKKYFIKKNLQIIRYNKGYGSTKFTYLFNKLFPSMASTNFIVVKKLIRH